MSSTTTIRGKTLHTLLVGGIERICLSQLSTTLLAPFSYNEIHNRRVALGILCVKCSPAQLDVLRNCGAMPVGSRRCGMITKKEAERLVNSFFDEPKPPALPDSFCFRVEHRRGYGASGLFYPSRYISSRAKCICCGHCGQGFSPNKFVFHMHEATGNEYLRPENLTNCNSWRRYIRLVDAALLDEVLLSAWEDVKAIFNGGARRKRAHSSSNSHTTAHSDCEGRAAPKRARTKRPSSAAGISADAAQSALPPTLYTQPQPFLGRNDAAPHLLQFMSPLYVGLLALLRDEMQQQPFCQATVCTPSLTR